MKLFQGERHTLWLGLHTLFFPRSRRWMHWIFTIPVCHRLRQGDFSDGQGESCWVAMSTLPLKYFLRHERIRWTPVFFFSTVGIVCRFSRKKPPNCFRSPRPLVSAGICLLVFNTTEWQMRIRDHEMASSVRGLALRDSQTLLSYTVAAPTPTLTQKSIFWKKRIWLNKLKKTIGMRGKEKHLNLFSVFFILDLCCPSGTQHQDQI